MTTGATPAVATAECRYGRMAFFAADAPIGSALREYGDWAQNEITLQAAFLKPGCVALDVGAHIGTHTLAFAAAVGREGHVIAFEPQPAIFALLQRNLAANGAPNTVAYGEAVGAHSGQIPVPAVDYYSPVNSGAVSFCEDAASSGLAVQVRTIDSLRLERLDLAKIDAEGMDYQVLTGMADTISRLRPVVFVEANDVDDAIRSLLLVPNESYARWVVRTAAFNPDNFRGSNSNFFGSAMETGLLFVPIERRDEVPHSRPGCQLIPVRNLAEAATAILGAVRYGDDAPGHRTTEQLVAEVESLRNCLQEQAERLTVSEFRAEAADRAVYSRDRSRQQPPGGDVPDWVLRSVSWRLTRPLRAAKVIFRQRPFPRHIQER